MRGAPFYGTRASRARVRLLFLFLLLLPLISDVHAEPVRTAGWAPFDCAAMSPWGRGRDGQHLAELALIPHRDPKRAEEFLANFRDAELRQNLAPDWQWLRHLPWLLDRALDSDYGRDVRAYFDGELDASLDWVENWTASRCRSDYDDLRYAVVQLRGRDDSGVRAVFTFHGDGAWSSAGHPVATVPAPGEGLVRFRERFRERFGREPFDAQLVHIASPLCFGPANPCSAATWEGTVVLAGADAKRLYRYDRSQPETKAVGVGDQRAVAMIGERVFRALVPIDSP